MADVSTAGAFVRKDAVFRHRIDPAGEFPPESGRYHLYVSYACPWASRCVSLLGLKGLDHVITMSSVHPTWQRTRPDDPNDTHAGWAFAGEEDDVLGNPAGVGEFPGGPSRACSPDDLYGSKFVRDLYDKVGAPPGTRFTVPILWWGGRQCIPAAAAVCSQNQSNPRFSKVSHDAGSK